jgi:hypothetical protein
VFLRHPRHIEAGFLGFAADLGDFSSRDIPGLVQLELLFRRIFQKLLDEGGIDEIALALLGVVPRIVTR